jgi:hypothetical protein
MRPSIITRILGIILILIGPFLGIRSGHPGIAVFPIIVGGVLVYLSTHRGRVATLIFGHSCIVVGAYLITWGILLLPHSEPTIAHVFGRPIFWGVFCLMGGICAIFHGFCRCVTKQVDQFEQIATTSDLRSESGTQK